MDTYVSINREKICSQPTHVAKVDAKATHHHDKDKSNVLPQDTNGKETSSC